MPSYISFRDNNVLCEFLHLWVRQLMMMMWSLYHSLRFVVLKFGTFVGVYISRIREYYYFKNKLLCRFGHKGNSGSLNVLNSEKLESPHWTQLANKNVIWSWYYFWEPAKGQIWLIYSQINRERLPCKSSWV